MFYPHQMGIYIHWPFCAAKCPYCDFNSHVRDNIDQSRFLEAYRKSLAYYAGLLPDKQVISVFFGGGTPSLMHAQTVQAILDDIQKHWRVANDLEVTLEANPTSVEEEKFAAFRSAGVNRISLGVQAMNDKDLKFLGRQHSVTEALRAIETAGRIFDRYSFDLIYARPQQALKDWECELHEAIKYARGHLSLYQLTIERNTPFYMQYSRGDFQIPDDVGGAEFYHLTQDILEDAGMPAYEVSNHARDGAECRHNLLYWHYADYIGIGAGAHGRFMVGNEKRATRDHNAPEIWVERVEAQGQGAHPYDIIAPEERFAEILMMGLRVPEGVSLECLRRLSGHDLHSIVDKPNLDRIIAEKWAILDNKSFRLTREGMLRLNSIIPYILKSRV